MQDLTDDANLCVGLFGTCGGSRWREEHFIPRYDELGIRWYNPQVKDWNPSCAAEEAEHLANDAVILFPVTNETYAFGSLAETGFSMLNAIRLDDRREFVLFIAQDIAATDPRGAPLVKQHLVKLRLPNVYLVDSLEEMFDVSVRLWESVKLRWPLRNLNPHRKSR